MTRDWTDSRTGESWKVHTASPDVPGGPYLVELTRDGQVVEVEYPGPLAPEELGDRDLRALLQSSTSRE